MTMKIINEDATAVFAALEKIADDRRVEIDQYAEPVAEAEGKSEQEAYT